MLDLTLFDRIRLNARPPVQRFIADAFLRLDYRKVDLEVEGMDLIPDHPVIYAMNHTDNFNYWPFQYTLHRTRARYTAAWVKGKNFESPVVSAFMRYTNNIPIASRGYLITRDFLTTMKRRPRDEEYRAIRDAVSHDTPIPSGVVPRELLETPRDIMGRRFDPARETYPDALDQLFRAMMRRFLELNATALAIGLDVLVFPQGTRSIRLSRGHIGLVQAALALGATVVPVGCNGSDRVYPGKSFVAKPGRVVYRVGQPFRPDDFADPSGALRIQPGPAQPSGADCAPPGRARPRFGAPCSDLAPTDRFEAFSREAEALHRDRLQALTDRVMERIDGLLDEPYRFADDRQSDGTRGTARFV